MSEHTEVYTQSQHEKEMTRLETQCKRWFIAFLVVLIMLFATNAAWVIYENSFQDVYISQEADTWDGGSNYINGTGEFIYGTRTPDDTDQSEKGVD